MIEFRLRLRAATLLTVGWGVPEVMGAGVVHARKLVGSRYELYIPGSSVKGALRTSAARIAGAYGFSSCGEVEPGRIREAHKRMGGSCHVCRLFGMPKMPDGDFDVPGESAVYVSDFRLVGGVATEVLTRVSIDDQTLSARRRALYTMEHLPPGAEFEGLVRLEEGGGALLPLLLLAVAELRTGRFGRRSIVDAKVDDGGRLEELIGEEWKPLLQRLRAWLWKEVIEV